MASWPRRACAHRQRPHQQEHHVAEGAAQYGVFKPESVALPQGVVARLREAGCDAVVLGCTELPLVLNDANCALPTLDSTRILTRAALDHA